MDYGIFIILVLIAFFYKIEIRRDRKELTFSNIQSSMNGLRGLMAVMIVLTHSTMAFQDVPILLMPFAKISTICVGFFFIASGYGLAWSNNNKKNYLNNKFLIKKIVYLFVLSVLAYAFILLIQAFNYIFMDGQNVIISVSDWWSTTNWYLKMQGLMYIIYFVVNRCVKNTKVSCWILGGTILLMCLAFCIFHVGGRSYFISEMSFFFGVVLYEYGDCIMKWFDKYMKYVIPVTGIICALSLGAFIVDDYTIADCVFHNLLCVSFCFVLIIFLYYFKVGNAILTLFNKISLELYLCQFALFALYKEIFRSMQQEVNVWYVLLVLVSDILVALIAVKINKGIAKGINKVFGN